MSSDTNAADRTHHGFWVHVIVKHGSRAGAAATVHSRLSHWFVEDVGTTVVGVGSLLFYRTVENEHRAVGAPQVVERMARGAFGRTWEVFDCDVLG